jgi:hypothetical protein
MKLFRALLWVAAAALAAVAAPGDAPAGGPRVFYSKSFPGSTPAYTQVDLDRSGQVEYREAPDDDRPLKFKLHESEVRDIFALIEKLDYFRRPLESPLKVAFMGTKTLRYENGSEKGEAKFNFSEDANARALADWFERIAESAQRRIELEMAAKYDRLGVVKALVALEGEMEHKRLVAQEQFLPILDRIARNESYMHTARERAAAMADAIRKGAQ